MRLLPGRPDHGRRRAAEEEAQADRRRHRRGDDQHLPLRHLSAHPRRPSTSAAGNTTAASTARRLRRRAMTITDIQPMSPAANSSSPAPPPAAASRSASMCPACATRWRQSALGDRGQRDRRLGLHQAQRGRRSSASPAPRWARARSPASPSSSARSSSATGRRSRPSIRRPGQNLARNRAWGDMSTGGSRGIRGSHDYVRQGGAAARRCCCRRRPTSGRCRSAELTVANGVITHAKSKRTTTYGKVAAAAAKLPAPDPKDDQAQGSEETGRSPASP